MNKNLFLGLVAFVIIIILVWSSSYIFYHRGLQKRNGYIGTIKKKDKTIEFLIQKIIDQGVKREYTYDTNKVYTLEEE